MPTSIFCFIWLGMLLGLLLFAAFPALADTITVPSGDVGALIDAINAANATPQADTINLEGGTYTLTAAVEYDFTLGSTGLPSITGNLTTNGNGAIIERSGAQGTPPFRLFYVISSGTLTLNDLTLRHGDILLSGMQQRGGAILNFGTLAVSNSTLSDSSALDGGAIFSSGVVTIDNCSVSDNSATSGGGIYSNDLGTLTITNSTLSGNSDSAIYNEGVLTISNSTLSGNTAWSGAAIYSTDGPVTISDSTLTGNNATWSGAAIYSTGGPVTISDSTLTGNSATWGAAIYNNGEMTIDNCSFSGNSGIQFSGNGGAIYNGISGTLTVTESSFSGNSARNAGGALANRGTARLTRSTLSANTSATGGAICNGLGQFTSATLLISGCTLSGNESVSNGGAIYNATSDSTVTISNSTLFGNSAAFNGGAVFNSGQMSISNSTLSGNFADWGGGISNNGPLTLKNSVVANSSEGGNCWGSSIFSLGHNLSSDNTCSAFLTAPGDLNNTDPRLDALADNGGPTPTMALLPGSPAIDVVPVSDCTDDANGNPLTVDQRGVSRPQGGACDIGAYEAEATTSSGFAVHRIIPACGGDGGLVDVHIAGNGFAQGATTRLERPGAPDIVGNPVVVENNGVVIRTTFDLTGKPRGTWDVVVINPGGGRATLPHGFAIEEGRGPKVWVDILGPRWIRNGVPQILYITCGNSGNSTAYWVPIVLSGIPADATVSLGFDIVDPPPLGDYPPGMFEFPDIFTAGAEQVVRCVLPKVSPGQTTHLPFLLRINRQGGLGEDIDLEVCALPPLATRPLLTEEEREALKRLIECYVEVVAAFDPTVEITKTAIELAARADKNTVWDYAKAVGGSVWAAVKKHPALDAVKGFYDIYDKCDPDDRKRRPLKPVWSWDPNDKAGAQGAGAPRYVAATEPLQYEIFFENLESATAPAQQVVITDTLDAANLDLSTLSLGPIGFGEHRIVPPAGVSDFSAEVDLRPENDLIVHVDADLDQDSGFLTWQFSSIDPETGFPTDDPLAGFLPPNTSPPEGEGSVVFSVMPRTGISTGTEIQNRTSIVFDTNPPIETPVWANTIDRDKPLSQVHELPATSSPRFTVEWSGSDAGAGIENYIVYVSEDGSPFDVWRRTPENSAQFEGEAGKTYSFFSVAQDQVRNVEDLKASAEATTAAIAAFQCDYVVAHWFNDDVAPNDPCQISLDQILQAIAWWADDAEVPETGGEKIDLDRTLDLIAKWADAACIDEPYQAIGSQASSAVSQWVSSPLLEASRSCSSTEIVSGQSVEVSIAVEAKRKFAGVALDEELPDGWSITPIESSEASPKPSEAQWLWLEMEPGGSGVVTYELRVPRDASPGRYKISGIVRSAHPSVFYEISGTTEIEVVPPPPLAVDSMAHDPNPVTDVRTVTFEAKGESIAGIRVSIFDMSGRRVFESGLIEGDSMDWHLEANSGEILANGVYLYIVEVLGLNGELVRSDVLKLAILR